MSTPMATPRAARRQPGPREHVYTTRSGLGGVFRVTITERLAAGMVRVRVVYPTDDWNGYSFTVHEDQLTPEVPRNER